MATLTAREERGLVIAATQKLTQKGKVWLVPSQTGNGTKYTVHPDAETPFCSCPDFEETGCKCKHLYAVETVMKRETAKDGTVTETRSITFTQKKTYKQEWGTYNLAQTEEKRRFLALLHDLCAGLVNPPQAGNGRRRSEMRDIVFTCVYKIYAAVSGRRFGTDMEEAFEKGHVTRKISSMMVWSWLESELLTPVLKQLIAKSAAPLRSVETEFAVDSSGFSTSRFVRWFDEKYGVERSGRDWVKCHIACGVKTHVVAAVEILDRDAADCPQFPGLVKGTAENFRIGEVSGDKAYLSAANIEAVFQHGGTPFIAFKENSTGSAGGLFEKMFHYYSLNRETYMEHYHKRSNVESTFSMVKAKFGDHVRSKKDVAMTNEVLCKILAHNLCCLIMSQFELGIESVFWGEREPQTVEVIDAMLVEKPTVTVDASVARHYGSCVGA
jgi:transposase